MILTHIQIIVQICKQITLLIRYEVRSRIVIFLNLCLYRSV